MTKKYLTSIALLAILLITLVPFASRSPDGLEKAAETLQLEMPTANWKGLMPDYFLETAKNPNIATVFAGIFGMFTVLLATFALGTIMVHRKSRN